MPPTLTIHCDCGTDIDAPPTDRVHACPNCESTFALTLLELPDESDIPLFAHGVRTYRGP